ncbi:MAG: hypothetical protein UH625_06800 [Muribaculaceae bacterium]|nr:hypothetical protein [Muribaculaceae bacterium]
MNNETETNNPKGKKTKKPAKLWKRILKFLFWLVASVLLIFIVACTLIVWILTPEKLTPMVEDAANDYLNAQVKIQKVELTFWHTFPKLTLDVDSLEVISKSLNELPDSLAVDLPADADSLLSVARMHAGVNLAQLGLGELALYDVIIDSPKANLLMVNDRFSNFDILPPAEADSLESSSSTIPSISINRFALTNASPLRFRNLADSTDVTLNINNIELKGDKAPVYALSVDMESRSPMFETFNLHNLPVNLNGAIGWDKSAPYSLLLNDFDINVDSLHLTFSTGIDFADTLRVTDFKGEVDRLPLSYLASLVPAPYDKAAKPLDTNMEVTLRAELTAPYTPSDTTRLIPDMKCEIDIPQCRLDYRELHLKRIIANLSADIDGGDINKSVFNLNKLVINGKAIDIDLNAELRDIISDPMVKADFKGRLNVEMLPDEVTQRFASLIEGKVKADIAVDMRMSHLQVNKFHKVKINGDIDLDDFTFVSTDSSTRAYVNKSCLEFGTNRRISTNDQLVDSLLTVSLKIDSGNINYETISLTMNNMKGSLGTRLTSHTVDTTQVNGFGGTLNFGNLRMVDSADSIRLRLTDVSCKAGLKRFNGDSKVPLLSLVFDARRVIGATPDAVAGLSKSHFDISAHLRKRATRNNVDSLARHNRRRRQHADADLDNIDMQVDSGMKALLRRWDVTGSVTADAGRMFIKAFPVTNSFRNVDLRFSTDSVNMRDLHYRLGHSDFLVNGYIGNIRRALTNSRRDNRLKIRLSVASDTLNVNELSQLAFADFGSDNHDMMASMEAGNIETAQISVNTDTIPPKAFMVPGNIEANLTLKAKNLIYTDIVFHDFSGEMMVIDKAINLRDLKASADIGNIDMTALYSTYEKNDIQFGMGLKINRFNLAKVMKLVPAIDTMMPMLNNFAGIIDADIAATSQIDSTMNFIIPSMQAAIKLSGDSLVLLDPDTFKFLSKWLMFKNKKQNMINHMSVEMVMDNNQLEIFPFMFDIDRYKLGVMGTNDMAFNLNYHISVLKSPLPFKFGINITGNVDDMKIRMGGAKFKENQSIERLSIADTTRINLVRQIENIFRRSARSKRLSINRSHVKFNSDTVAISHSDSLLMIREGFIPAPVDSTNVSR